MHEVRIRECLSRCNGAGGDIGKPSFLAFTPADWLDMISKGKDNPGVYKVGKCGGIGISSLVTASRVGTYPMPMSEAGNGPPVYKYEPSRVYKVSDDSDMPLLLRHPFASVLSQSIVSLYQLHP